MGAARLVLLLTTIMIDTDIVVFIKYQSSRDPLCEAD
jgi:hypothetical protein